MKNILNFFIVLIWSLSLYSQSQVTNINVYQEYKTIAVEYDYIQTGTFNCKISLLWTSDDGVNWFNCNAIEGDFGIGVKTGRRKIVWDVLKEFEEFNGEGIQFKVFSDCEPNLDELQLEYQEKPYEGE